MFVDVQGGCIVGDDAPASRGAFVNAPLQNVRKGRRFLAALRNDRFTACLPLRADLISI